MCTETTFTRSFTNSKTYLLKKNEATISEGPGHKGKSAMIDFVAKL